MRRVPKEYWFAYFQKHHICIWVKLTPKNIDIWKIATLFKKIRIGDFYVVFEGYTGCVEIIFTLNQCRFFQAVWMLHTETSNTAMERQFCDLSESVRFQNLRQLIKFADLSNHNLADFAYTDLKSNFKFRGCLWSIWPQIS